MEQKLIIAVDGYSACGKSTFSRSLAKALNYTYIDSGAMYRAVTLYFLSENVNEEKPEEIEQALNNIHISFSWDEKEKVGRTHLNNQDVEFKIRQLEVAENVSRVSAIKQVRTKLMALQRSLGVNKGLVMDGRDIGSRVFPEADLKLFMTADPEVRAVRRYQELNESGVQITMEQVRKNIWRETI